MNKNILIAILVFAAGGLYYYNKNHIYSGNFSESGIYTDSKDGFAVIFPKGWRKSSEKETSSENGFSSKVNLKSSLVVISPEPNRVEVLLIPIKGHDEELESFAKKYFKVLYDNGYMGIKYSTIEASKKHLKHMKISRIQTNGDFVQISFFKPKEKIFMLYLSAEKGYSSEVPNLMGGIVDSVRRI
jgi:hypothetical protein